MRQSTVKHSGYRDFAGRIGMLFRYIVTSLDAQLTCGTMSLFLGSAGGR